MTLIGGLRAGLGGVRTTAGPVESSGANIDDLTLWSLQLAYGQGNGSTDQELPALGSFWLGADTNADGPTAGQVREWVVTTDLASVGIFARIDVANLNEGTGLLIVTLDGVDTLITIAVPDGTSDTTLEAAAVLPVTAGHRIGVRWDGSDVIGAPDTPELRCEVRVEGYGPDHEITPAPLPTDDILLRLEGDDLQHTGTQATGWTDTSGNGYSPNLVTPQAVYVPNFFNGHPAFQSSDGDQTFGGAMLRNGAAILAPNSPRTTLAVLELIIAQQTSPYFTFGTVPQFCGYKLDTNLGTQWAHEKDQSFTGDISFSDGIVSYVGQKIIVQTRTTGAIGDPLEVFVNGVKRPTTGNMVLESGLGGYLIGYDNINHWWRGYIGAVFAWSVRQNDAEMAAALSYAQAKYL